MCLKKKIKKFKDKFYCQNKKKNNSTIVDNRNNE